MRLLILGGTLFLSRQIAETALRRGHDVTVASRGQSGTPPGGARFVAIDREAQDGLAPLAGQAFDAVIDVARLPAQAGAALDVLADRAGHWTFVSSGSVYADSATPGQNAQDAPLLQPAAPDSTQGGWDVYGNNKVACENFVRERMEGRAFIVRPGLIVGNDDPNDRFGYWPWRIAQGGDVLAPGAPQDFVQFIDVRDQADWIVEAAESGLSGTFDAIGAPMPRGEFLSRIAAALGADPDFVWVPQDFLTEQGVRPWMGEDALGLWLPLPDYAGFMTQDVAASLAAGLKTRPLEETARDWMAWAPPAPVFAAGLSREKEAAVLNAWQERQS